MEETQFDGDMRLQPEEREVNFLPDKKKDKEWRRTKEPTRGSEPTLLKDMKLIQENVKQGKDEIKSEM